MTFPDNLRGPLDAVLAELPTDTIELRTLGQKLRDKIQVDRDAGAKVNMTDVEKLIGIMHLLQKRERAEDN